MKLKKLLLLLGLAALLLGLAYEPYQDEDPTLPLKAEVSDTGVIHIR